MQLLGSIGNYRFEKEGQSWPNGKSCRQCGHHHRKPYLYYFDFLKKIIYQIVRLRYVTEKRKVNIK